MLELSLEFEISTSIALGIVGVERESKTLAPDVDTICRCYPSGHLVIRLLAF